MFAVTVDNYLVFVGTKCECQIEYNVNLRYGVDCVKMVDVGDRFEPGRYCSELGFVGMPGYKFYDKEVI